MSRYHSMFERLDAKGEGGWTDLKSRIRPGAVHAFYFSVAPRLFGPLADRIGRKKGVAISFALFTSATVMTGFANTPEQFAQQIKDELAVYKQVVAKQKLKLE